MKKRPVPASDLSIRAVYTLMTEVFQPRPIGCVGTTSAAGIHNIAPFSYFMPIGSAPPTVAFSSAKDRNGKEKNTLDNILEMGVFTLSMVTADLIEQMNASSATVPASVSEFDETGLTAVPGTWVNAPYVEEAHVTSECRVLQTIPLGNTTLVIGEILGFHMSETWDAKDGVPAHVGRLSSTNYILTSGEQVSLPRPV